LRCLICLFKCCLYEEIADGIAVCMLGGVHNCGEDAR
jgi:hypothetical protein